MKKLVQLLSVFSLFVILAGCKSDADQADWHYADGKPGQYEDFTGKPLVINYWAEWCKPCIEEIPELNEFDKEHEGIQVIGINYDRLPPKTLQEISAKLGIEFPVITAKAHEHYGFEYPKVLPTTVIISPDGKVQKILKGPQNKVSLSKAIQ